MDLSTKDVHDPGPSNMMFYPGCYQCLKVHPAQESRVLIHKHIQHVQELTTLMAILTHNFRIEKRLTFLLIEENLDVQEKNNHEIEEEQTSPEALVKTEEIYVCKPEIENNEGLALDNQEALMDEIHERNESEEHVDNVDDSPVNNWNEQRGFDNMEEMYPENELNEIKTGSPQNEFQGTG